MLIKIINGTYGHRTVGSKAIVPIKAGDPPFEIEDDKAKRLISLCVAVQVPQEAVATDAEANSAPAANNDMEQGSGIYEGKESGFADGDEIPAYSIKTKMPELRELMERFGLSYRVGMTKVEMVAVLDEFFGEDAEDDDADDEKDAEDVEVAEDEPELGAAPPVV